MIGERLESRRSIFPGRGSCFWPSGLVSSPPD